METKLIQDLLVLTFLNCSSRHEIQTTSLGTYQVKLSGRELSANIIMAPLTKLSHSYMLCSFANFPSLTPLPLLPFPISPTPITQLPPPITYSILRTIFISCMTIWCQRRYDRKHVTNHAWQFAPQKQCTRFSNSQHQGFKLCAEACMIPRTYMVFSTRGPLPFSCSR